MASMNGFDGLVKIGATAVGELQEWTLDERAATFQTTAAGQAWAKTHATTKSFSGTVKLNFDKNDALQQINAGDVLALSLYPNPDASGGVFFDGDGVVESVSISSPKDNAVTMDIAFTGDGTLTRSTVV